MMPQHFTSERWSPLNFGAAPYLPPVTSDVVIDLSHWQAPVDFSKAKEAGIVAVILKATQGSKWIDATFTQRFTAATAAGLLVGAYRRQSNRWKISCRWQRTARCSRSTPSQMELAAL